MKLTDIGEFSWSRTRNPETGQVTSFEVRFPAVVIVLVCLLFIVWLGGSSAVETVGSWFSDDAAAAPPADSPADTRPDDRGDEQGQGRGDGANQGQGPGLGRGVGEEPTTTTVPPGETTFPESTVPTFPSVTSTTVGAPTTTPATPTTTIGCTCLP